MESRPAPPRDQNLLEVGLRGADGSAGPAGVPYRRRHTRCGTGRRRDSSAPRQHPGRTRPVRVGPTGPAGDPGPRARGGRRPRRARRTARQPFRRDAGRTGPAGRLRIEATVLDPMEPAIVGTRILVDGPPGAGGLRAGRRERPGVPAGQRPPAGHGGTRAKYDSRRRTAPRAAAARSTSPSAGTGTMPSGPAGAARPRLPPCCPRASCPSTASSPPGTTPRSRVPRTTTRGPGRPAGPHGSPRRACATGRTC
jgi:hypothetical protein